MFARKLGRAVGCCLLLLPMLGHVAEVTENSLAIERPWVLGISAQVDDERNDGFFASFNWGVASRTWLAAAIGRSRSPQNRADVVADAATIGIDHDFGPIGLMFDLERWGESGALDTEAFNATVYVQKPAFRIGLRHANRDIEIGFTATGPLGRTVSRTAALSSTSVELSARVRLAERWQLYASHVEVDYSRNLELLPRIDALNWLGTSALTLAYSFIDTRSTFGFERQAGSRVIRLDMGRHESAVDHAQFRSIDAAMLFPVGVRLDLEVHVGRSQSDRAADGLYGGLSLLIYGGR